MSINNCFTILDQIKEKLLFFKAQKYLNLDAERCPSKPDQRYDIYFTKPNTLQMEISFLDVCKEESNYGRQLKLQESDMMFTVQQFYIYIYNIYI